MLNDRFFDIEYTVDSEGGIKNLIVAVNDSTISIGGRRFFVDDIEHLVRAAKENRDALHKVESKKNVEPSNKRDC